MEKQDIKAIQERLSHYENSDYSSGYMAIKNQLDKWAAELQNSPVTLTYKRRKKKKDEEGMTINELEDDMYAFNKVHKFISTVDQLYEKLEWLRSKMSPEQQKSADDKIAKFSKKTTDQVGVKLRVVNGE